MFQAIEKVKKENERLKEQVEAETRSRSDNTAVHSHTLRLAEQVESYKSKIELEQRRLEELDRQHKIMQVSQCTLQSQKLRMLTSFGSRATDWQ
jgi:hypothetical protein